MNEFIKKVPAILVLWMLVSLEVTVAEQGNPATRNSDLPRVLLIGDSIACQYAPYVAEILQGKALVEAPRENAGPTMRGITKLDRWLGSDEWDIIHFNWGLWDMYGWRYMEVDRSPKAYEERLEILVLRLKETGAKLIWAATTPICPEAERTGGITLTPEIEKQYLDAAGRVMKKHAVQVNDLHSFTKLRRDEFALAGNDVHYNEAGRKKHAEQVAQHIMIAASEEVPVVPHPDLPKVLFIGDSISSGYTPYVKEMLKGEANVQRTMGNAQHTRNGLKHLDKWLGETRWNVIHFNWGLWDLCYRHPDSKVQGNRDKVNGTLTTPLDQYEENLDQLVARLKKTKAKLIWAHTTVVPEDEAGRFVGDDEKYNEAAARVMKKYGVRINDLNTLTSGFPAELFAGTGNVHYRPEGYVRIGRQVAKEIRAALRERGISAEPGGKQTDAVDRAPTPASGINWPEFMSRHDLVWDQLPQNWNAGSFEGNGMLGSVVYQADAKALCWQMGHAEVTQRQIGANGRMPIGRLFLKTVGTIQSGTMRLDLWNAETVMEVVTDKGTLRIRSLIHSDEMVQAVVLETTGDESAARFSFKPGLALKRAYTHPWAAYMDAVTGMLQPYEDGEIWVTDRGEGGEYATAWQEGAVSKSRRLVLLTVAQTYPEKNAVDQAKKIIASVRAQDWASLEKRHRAWWHAYYPASFVTVPNSRVETFYWIQLYKLACATRGDRAICSTLGPWFRQTYWPRVWLNYNTQTFYSPVYGANRAELGESLLNFLKTNRENLSKHAKVSFGTDDGFSCPPSAPHAGWWNIRKGGYNNPGDFAWIMYCVWQHYRHTMDHSMVMNGKKHGLLYEYLRKLGNVYLKTCSKGEDGNYHLPVWMSPEYKRVADNNYNLSGCRFVFQALLELSERYGIDDPLIPEWKDRLDHLVDYPSDSTGYMVGVGVPFTAAHRHWSHLQMIFPYYQVDLDDPAVRDLAVKSINHWTDAEPVKSFYGWSAAAAASLHAATGDGNQALKWLLRHHNDSRFVMPNTMYLESYPVIESATIAARSLQDMLLQSHNGVIRVFPAVPDAWKASAFSDMRAEGAFLVSALREGGKTQWIRIKSLAGESCVVRAHFDGTPQAFGKRAFHLTPRGRHTWEVDLQKAEEVVLRQEGQGDVVMSPLQAPDAEWNYYGINRNGKTEAEYQELVKRAVLKKEETR